MQEYEILVGRINSKSGNGDYYVDEVIKANSDEEARASFADYIKYYVEGRLYACLKENQVFDYKHTHLEVELYKPNFVILEHKEYYAKDGK